ncbi:ATP-dependent rRNA helicase SPB4, putative [Plasmodium berghei]|uniref:ATP-dependent RNA helicase n=2 Tax=Plasmodium berghei TaxID=5821 RepID=A0A509ALD4_PLABA|nr:ATP-dependent rRNA helicase SPB4, putative [Plasmodium berghei ANKA]CXI53726.1 ATP-dependent rRNA helicase SPB4, putative [Plasmodium berghei]SCL94845.1 ATP-dependent rRNA helicase SPB4, putative [Plasmodium berghei]SCM16116.1 ATP-dependent rRNA helicase SPB4, putative [Plasmodium berghei]SCM17912.1 ATP-dependent rRNA helicase SPB4, putative [Plasmodium berghei]SCN26250.1 ATP-dependent rRNA helicase SPB4, putative [Plasmodium berghei]|eukprot:XP_034422040.1 ATP-dependent rRNA helicase SPB4, putative [Plasmodium berghei ANKA]
MIEIEKESKTKEREKKKPFTDLNLDNSIIFSLFIQKYFYCAKIQEISIPHILKKNENILLQSETGTGKTLCFAIPILQTLVNYKKQISISSEKSCKEKTKCNPDDTHIDNTAKANDFFYDENSINSIYDYFQKCEITKCKSIPFNINVDKFISYTNNNNIIKNKNSIADIDKEQNQDTNEEGFLTKEKLYNSLEEKTKLITNVNPEIKQNENDQKSTEPKDDEKYKERAKRSSQFNISEITAIKEDNEIFHNLNRNKEDKGIDVNTIIITPTRELCIQIYNVINKFLFFIRLYFSNKFNVNLKILDRDNFFINSLLFRGAVKIEDDIKVLENEKKKKNTFQIITATPGKLANLFKDYDHLFNTSKLKYFILDEGDKLLEESYINYVKDVVNNITSNDYITCICSATCLYEDKICSLFPSGLKKKKTFRIIVNPKEGENVQQSNLNVISSPQVYLNNNKQDNENITTTFAMSNRIENYYIVLRNIDKLFFLFKFLNTVLSNGETAIVFFPTCFCVDYYFHMFKSIFSIKNLYNNDGENLFEHLAKLNKLYNNICTDDEMLIFSKMICYIQNYIGKNKINFLKIHRKMKDKKRISAYNKITDNKKLSKKKNVIFCTDVMSRGININIQWVINYDVPNKNMTYIHRSGRTGRFDKTGKNIIFINKKEKEYLYFLKSKKVNIYNFKKTYMFQNMIKYESIIIKTEHRLNKEALKLAKRNSDCINFLEKKQFFTNCDTINSQSKAKNISKNQNKNENEKEKSEHVKKETLKRQNIIIPNNIITIFLKLIIFYVIENREMFNLSTKAFLSYIEFYKNHQLNFLFPFSKLNISHLCHTFALVKIPKFKEKEKVKNFKSFDINIYDIPYKNSEKEKKRLENKKKKKEDRDKNLKKGQTISTEQNNTLNKNKKKRKTIVQKKHEKREMDQNEIDSLFFEENLFKKLKKKKITDEEYDRLLGIDDLDKLFTSNPSKKNTQIVKTSILQNSNKKKSKKKQKVYNLKVKKIKKNSKRRR